MTPDDGRGVIAGERMMREVASPVKRFRKTFAPGSCDHAESLDRDVRHRFDVVRSPAINSPALPNGERFAKWNAKRADGVVPFDDKNEARTVSACNFTRSVELPLPDEKSFESGAIAKCPLDFDDCIRFAARCIVETNGDIVRPKARLLNVFAGRNSLKRCDHFALGFAVRFRF
jgi:hypothetical protein